ncbi:uncharacterized protein LOC119743606 [Patiria miniata]|uniref:Uncharacterized protein n=1 Tax=Patiria miniata TaxID=46514 RepID=A0A914BJ64_PATMI|nr:uncharacterized protein LOC119743606 [Patiria miniata]
MSEHHADDVLAEENRDESVASKHSGSQRTNSSSSSRNSHLSGLSDKDAAKMRTLRRRIRLNELECQLQEDQTADEQLRKLDEQARSARLKAEEVERQALREREALTSKLSRQRRVRIARQELCEAEAISAMLNNESSSSPSHPLMGTDDQSPPQSASSTPQPDMQQTSTSVSSSCSTCDISPRHSASTPMCFLLCLSSDSIWCPILDLTTGHSANTTLCFDLCLSWCPSECDLTRISGNQ